MLEMSVLSSFVYILVAHVWSSKSSIKLAEMNSKFSVELGVTRFITDPQNNI